jgi:hypothetical protein
MRGTLLEISIETGKKTHPFSILSNLRRSGYGAIWHFAVSQVDAPAFALSQSGFGIGSE